MRRIPLPLALLSLAAACAAPRSSATWFADAAALHAADADGFPAAATILDGFDVPGDRDRIETGDRVLYGIRLDLPSGTERLMVLFEVVTPIVTVEKDGRQVPLTASARFSLTPPPPKPGQEPDEVVVVELESPCATLRARVYDAFGKVLGEDLLLVTRDLLTEGILDGCLAINAAEARGRQDRESRRKLGFSIFACLEFLKLVRGSKALNAILERAMVVDMWSVLWHFGIEVSLALDILDGEAFAPGAGAGPECFRFPMSVKVNGTSALDCSVVVAGTASPYNLGAGVVSVVGIRPGTDAGGVTLRLLAARRGAGPD